MDQTNKSCSANTVKQIVMETQEILNVISNLTGLLNIAISTNDHEIIAIVKEKISKYVNML